MRDFHSHTEIPKRIARRIESPTRLARASSYTLATRMKRVGRREQGHSSIRCPRISITVICGWPRTSSSSMASPVRARRLSAIWPRGWSRRHRRAVTTQSGGTAMPVFTARSCVGFVRLHVGRSKSVARDDLDVGHPKSSGMRSRALAWCGNSPVVRTKYSRLRAAAASSPSHPYL